MPEEYPESQFYSGGQSRSPVMPTEFHHSTTKYDFSLDDPTYRAGYEDSMPPPQGNFSTESWEKIYLTAASAEEISNPTETKAPVGLLGRSKKLGSQGVTLWNKTISADGADKSGMRDLIYTSIVNNAADAAMILPLAKVLLFNTNVEDSKINAAIFLLVTLIPYAIIAPLIGPLLDRIHTGRRTALTCTFFIRTILAIILVCKAQYVDEKIIFSHWLLYICTILMLLSSKSYTVLKAAITPRIVPEQLDLVQVNSRINTFATLVGTLFLGGTITAICEFLITYFFHIPGGFLWMAIVCIAGGFLCLKLPIKVESNKAEVPIGLTQHFRTLDPNLTESPKKHKKYKASRLTRKRAKQPLGIKVITCLTGVSTLKLAIGFLYLFMIFYPRSPLMQHTSLLEKILVAAAGAGANGVGGFLGNILGAKIPLAAPEKTVLICSCISFVVFGGASFGLYLGHGNLMYIVIAAFITAICANSAKVSLDSSIQSNLAHNARASAFGLSESILQIGWVLGAALGALLPPKPDIAFSVISGIMFLGMIETIATYHKRPVILKRALHNANRYEENPTEV